MKKFLEMGKKFLIVLVLIIVVLVLIAVFASGPAEAPAPGEPSSETTTSRVPAPGAEVVYTDAGFSPNPLTIQSGEKVVFRNESSANFWPASAMHPTHAVYGGTSLSEHCPDGSEAFDACTAIASGESWSFTFVKVGTWRYHDHLTPGRTGTIVVE